MKQSYNVSEVASLLNVTPDVAGALVRLVFSGEREVLTFQDLVLLRTAKGLADRRVPKRRIAEALGRLREQMPKDQPLSAVTLAPSGKELVVSVASGKWNAASGQGLLDLGGQPPRPAVWLREVKAAPRRDAEALFARAVELEEADPAGAVDAYSEALATNPHHADAHVNVGRLLHQRGKLKEAEAHYVAALVSRPTDATATFNLAVVLEDLGRVDDAMSRYLEAIELDPQCVDAYFNLARLYEKKGEKMAAIRHLKDYRRLTR
ncbi:MAG: tetratricopeptide repeat protein [Myxococcales bacterium]|nr:tetratricopeptide repeat protein [Myxococcales bacterium]